jgi:signal transduction histidine kinase
LVRGVAVETEFSFRDIYTMHDQTITQDERNAIEAEQVKAYFEDANVLNVAGIIVFSLLIYVVYDLVPMWVWAPTLFFLVLITLVRAYLIRQYHRAPEFRSTRFWINSHAVGGGLAGVCWGITVTAMLIHLSLAYQLFVLMVSVVVAATATSEGFALVLPSRLFTIASISPITLWMLTVSDRLHTVIALMLLLFLPVTIMLGSRKNHVFVEAQRLLFKNETLVKELSRQHDLLEAASNSKSRFLAAASHDLRQPLAALMIFLEQLEFERQLSASGKDLLEHAQLATGSLCTLLDGLLDISRLDGNAVKPKIKSFAIQRIFNELEEEFQAQAAQKGIRLKFLPCSSVIESDILLLQQILRNLISNALCYTPSGRILVGCRHHDGKLSIEVHDTGIGISEDQFPRIFDEFYQIDNPERDRRHGLGLGLSIVDRAARLLGHSVKVTSKLGKGAAFVVTVPISQSGSFDVQPDSVSLPGTFDLTGRLVAIVENDGSIRTGMQSLLQSWGCSVVVADSASGMLEQFNKLHGRVEMVISDFGLRGSVNGVDAIALIRQRLGDKLPALLFTGDISKETYALARKAGVPILYKPAKAEALRNAIVAAFAPQPTRDVLK